MALEGSLDLFVLMVEYTTGSIALSIIVWALLLLVVGIMGRMSMKSITILLATFLAVASMGYMGTFFGILVLMGALWYMITGFKRVTEN